MEVKYETGKKEMEIEKGLMEIERQQNIIARQNRVRWLLAAGIAVCAVFVALLWYMLRLRNRRNIALTERNNTLSEMNAAKDKFFNIISHDLKNPAVALLDALRILVKNGRQWDTDLLTEYYDELLHSAEGHVELIFHLLNWAKTQTGRIVFQREKFYLAARLHFDVAQVRSMAEKKGITLTDRISGDVCVTGDANIVAAVVRNLLTNAVKFTPAGGTVVLEVSPNYLCRGKACLTPTGYTISVSDSGIGMSREQVEMLRNAETQSIASLHSCQGTDGEQGSGLGLIVCRELLEKHDSKLYMESEEGKGTRFWFEL
jgi:signal transduction histidine kinase